jgi:hypothetical protein
MVTAKPLNYDSTNRGTIFDVYNWNLKSFGTIALFREPLLAALVAYVHLDRFAAIVT